VAELPVEVAEEFASASKALTERIASLAVELNDKAVKAAERRVHEVVRSAGEQREQAERELTDASQTVDDLETKLDEANADVDGLEKRLDEVKTSSQAQAVELAQLRERLAVTEQAAKTSSEQLRGELAEQKQASQTLASERDQVRTDLATVKAKADAAEQTHQEQYARHQQETEQLRAEMAEQKKTSQILAIERDRAHTDMATLKAKADSAKQAHQEQNARHQQEVEQLHAELTAQKEAGQALAVERDQIRAELATVTTRADATDQLHQEQIKRSAEENDRAAERMTKAKAAREEARKEASAAREEAAKLRGQVEAMQSQAAELIQTLGNRQA
jgi:predicted  nucleic acid-binding Zn-ribbon protein